VASSACQQGKKRKPKDEIGVMEFRFNAQEWEGLTIQERIRRCLVMTHEAEALAAFSRPALKVLYSQLAEQWKMIAAEMELNSPRPRPDRD
jgi:hypothetical protein